MAQPTTFPTQHQEILKMLSSIDPVLYGKTRNYINGAVTYLSPYISRGYLSLKQVQQHALEKYSATEIERFLQELAWREYFQRVWEAKGLLLFKALRFPQEKVLHYEMVKSIKDAATGIEAIDSHIENLYQNGYMHNHMRMYIASLSCNIAGAYWEEPSRWLYYHLLDGDIASNTCSWQWVAGSFASKKYYCNQENINRYTGTDQTGTFLDKEYEALPAMDIPFELSGLVSLNLKTILPDTTLPDIDTTLPTLVYNSYNLDPVWRSGEQANRILLLEPSHFSKYPVSEKIIEFITSLSKNIPGIKICYGEITDLVEIYNAVKKNPDDFIISKKHPAFLYYPGRKDERDWMFPEVSGYYTSFFSYWKQCRKYLNTENS